VALKIVNVFFAQRSLKHPLGAHLLQRISVAATTRCIPLDAHRLTWSGQMDYWQRHPL